MKSIINNVRSAAVRFAKDEEGAQVVEYALIIAVVSIVLVLALGNETDGLGSSFEALVGRVSDCFTGGPTCAGPAPDQ